ncbi:MAG: DotU family type IV/VI secretion system protein [Alphaproteobacteria bacterium]|nr:DotU family type IV/VI secretion system protein [Alphaproteobacteria bacterium]
MTLLRSNFIASVFQDFYEEILRQKERALRESEDGNVHLFSKKVSPKQADDEEGVLDEGNRISSDAMDGNSIDVDANDNNADLSTETNDEALAQAYGDESQESFQFEGSIVEKNIELCHNIQRKLRIMLEEQSLKASYQLGEYAQTNFREAQYLMAALADETFLTIAWPGKKQWRKHILETQLFHTQVAGELFFSRLDLLLEAADPTRSDLAVVYLLCLSLGFRGKYRDLDDEGKIDFYKKRLYHLINNRESDLYSPGRKYLSNALYEHNISVPFSKGLPDVRRWLMTFAGVGCVYLFVTYVLWYKLVRDLDEALQFIFDQARFLPL